MKKLYKRVNSKCLTIESMYTCLVKCSTGCKYCTAGCSDITVAGAMIGAPAVGGDVDEILVAIGSAVG